MIKGIITLQMWSISGLIYEWMNERQLKVRLLHIFIHLSLLFISKKWKFGEWLFVHCQQTDTLIYVHHALNIQDLVPKLLRIAHNLLLINQKNQTGYYLF